MPTTVADVRGVTAEIFVLSMLAGVLVTTHVLLGAQPDRIYFVADGSWIGLIWLAVRRCDVRRGRDRRH